VHSRIRELEDGANWREARLEEKVARLEEMIYDQQVDIRALEDLVRAIMHKNRNSGKIGDVDQKLLPDSPKFKKMINSKGNPDDIPRDARRFSMSYTRRRSR
jgi:hypothetical protein